MNLVWTSVLFGLGFSVVFTALFGVAAAFARDFGLNNWPQAIQDRYGAQSARGARVTRIVAAVLVPLVAGMLAALMLTLRAQSGEIPGFLTALLAAEIALMTFNLFDLVVLDWLIINLWLPSFVVLPGTEGMPEYRDWRFHLVGFGKGVVIVSGLALAAAFVTLLVKVATQVD